MTTETEQAHIITLIPTVGRFFITYKCPPFQANTRFTKENLEELVQSLNELSKKHGTNSFLHIVIFLPLYLIQQKPFDIFYGLIIIQVFNFIVTPFSIKTTVKVKMDQFSKHLKEFCKLSTDKYNVTIKVDEEFESERMLKVVRLQPTNDAKYYRVVVLEPISTNIQAS
ncbi:hypothetical protein HDV02_000691 [Globomyces sp. JEL0801]|nr:hypothetical protein HDV02_000691 [Globomyces sp. JEL0801]